MKERNLKDFCFFIHGYSNLWATVITKVAIKRYQTYEKSSKPVIEYYEKSKLLKVIKGEATITEINSEISGIIEAIKGWLWIISQYKYAG